MEGLYNISAAINVGGGGGTSAVVIQGMGWNTQLKLNNSTNAYIFDFGSSGSPQFTMGLTMKDLRLNCNGANQSSAGGGIYARGAVWCVFDHIFFDTPWEAGIRFYQDGTGSYGHHNSIVNCLFRDGKNTNGGQGWAIKFEQADENKCFGCTFQDNGNNLGQGHDAQIYDTSAGLQSIIGCNFVGGGSSVTMIKTDSSPSRMSIMGNQFDGPNGAYCIELAGNGCQVLGNAFIGIGTNSGGNVAGVHINGTSGHSVVGNEFTSSGAHAIGVLEDSGSGGNVIEGNTFSGTFASGPVTTGSTSTTFVANNPGHNPVLTTAVSVGVTSATPYVLASGTSTITLPTAVGCSGYKYTIKKTDASNTLTIATTSAQTIDGSSTATITVQNVSLTLESDNANWRVV